MKPKLLFLFSTLLNMCVVNSAIAQDPHFSQFFETPLLLNPARAGFINGTFQLTGVYRSQWKDITVPFKTLAGTANVNIPAGKNKNNIFGVAISDFADKAGDATYTINHIDVALGYHRNFGSDFNRYIGFGIVGSYASTTFDAGKITLDENFMGGTATEAIGSNNGDYFDIGAGIEYNFLDDEQHFNVGVACFHILQPAISYLDNTVSEIYRKYVGTIGYSGVLSQTVEVLPRAVFLKQGPSQELLAGADFKINLTQNATTKYAVYAGGYYRFGDALIPKFRLDMGDLSFGFSYDFTTSKLSQVSETAGGPEITLVYIGRIKGISAGRIYNPRF